MTNRLGIAGRIVLAAGSVLAIGCGGGSLHGGTTTCEDFLKAETSDQQKAIVQIARRLAADGTISFGAGDDDYV